jgi:hypothetical protein
MYVTSPSFGFGPETPLGPATNRRLNRCWTSLSSEKHGSQAARVRECPARPKFIPSLQQRRVSNLNGIHVGRHGLVFPALCQVQQQWHSWMVGYRDRCKLENCGPSAPYLAPCPGERPAISPKQSCIWAWVRALSFPKDELQEDQPLDQGNYRQS